MSTANTFCQSCGAQLGKGARFCGGCGSKIEPVQQVEADRTDKAEVKAPLDTSVPAGHSLLECSACRKQIAMNARACPNCGAPNAWVHPQIRRFVDASIEMAHFHYSYQNALLNGWTGPRSTMVLNVGVTLALIALFFSFVSLPNILSRLGLLTNSNAVMVAALELIVVYGGGAVGVIAVLAGMFMMFSDESASQKTFKVDFSADPPSWECNDEEFWKPVKVFLGLHAPTASRAEEIAATQNSTVPIPAKLGACPNCEAHIPMSSEQCPKCKASFVGPDSWKVRPL